MRIALILSILAHVALLIVLSKRGGEGDGDGKASAKKHENIKVSIIDKPSDKEVKQKQIPPPENKSKVVVKKKKKVPPEQKYVDHKCADWYGGVGIQHPSPGSYEVAYVGKGYPADRAGILVGDLVLNGDELRGTPGTKVVVHVMRGSRALTFYLVREKICTKDLK